MLEIITAEGAMPTVRQRIFRESGGRIGRHQASDWVLPHNKVSAEHAIISYRNGVFYIEDRSRNGVFINSNQRLTRLLPTALKSGDCLFIEPYEIQVSITEDADERSLSIGRDEDPFASQGVAPLVRPVGVDAPGGFASAEEPAYEVDPMKILSGAASTPSGKGDSPRQDTPPGGNRAIAGPIHTADEFERGDPMRGHYKVPPAAYDPLPPPPQPAVASSTPPAVAIPLDYDPLPPLSKVHKVPEPSKQPRPVIQPQPPGVSGPGVEAERVDEKHTTDPSELSPLPPRRPAAPPDQLPTPPRGAQDASMAPPIVQQSEPKVVEGGLRPETDLAAVLSAAGLGHIPVTPELAEGFGRILKVVVAGVMSILAARQQIKDEFRMRQTQFKPTDNNPLKFSANVDHALRNLFVDRNPAYLEPVEAFTDAFDDLRDHQLAMVAGLRVAFESMLAEFDPDQLEQQFDRQLKKAALISVPAKLRYWEAYRDRIEQLLKDVDATFRRWFGEEFVKAYEEQLERLETERREKPQ